jgi:hypothetical protein
MPAGICSVTSLIGRNKMKTRPLILFLFFLSISVVAFSQKRNTGPYTPARGSTERKAILDALRGSQDTVFQVHYFKVHDGWCWVDTTPLDKQGRATAEGGPNLLHLEAGTWKVMDLAKVPEDPDDPLGPEDASPTFVKNVMKTFPGVPRDIFPKPSK